VTDLVFHTKLSTAKPHLSWGVGGGAADLNTD
jgi:hypothetical protein